MAADREQTMRQLRTEIAALEGRLDSQNHLIESLKEQLSAHETRSVDERRTQVFRRAARDIVEDQTVREFGEHPEIAMKNMGDALVALGGRLDHKFAEMRALSEITEDINAGVFFDEVLDHVFESFDRLVPFDRIGVALLEQNAANETLVRARWSRSHYESAIVGKGYSARLSDTSLGEIIKSRRPRIINDLVEYQEQRPQSRSSRLMIKEGIRSSLTCPLIARDKVIGFIFFSCREPGTYETQHAEIYLQIAGELALNLEKSRAYEELYLRNEFIKKVFGRYVTDEVAEAVLNDESLLDLGGDRRDVTVLMSDIRGFTPMSEEHEPEEVVETLNKFLGSMTEVIMDFGGSVDNFIGDAVLAVFGLPAAKSDDAERAVACAIEMHNQMEPINAYNLDHGLPSLSMGIGLNTGSVVAGNIGSEKRMKFSVIGSPVNIASRIQSLTSGGQIFASEATVQMAGPNVQTAGNLNVKVKGVEDPLPVYEIIGIAGKFGRTKR